jgi:hypothetical protein
MAGDGRHHRLPNRPAGRHISTDDHDQVDQERAELGDVVFAGDVADADQGRGANDPPIEPSPPTETTIST